MRRTLVIVIAAAACGGIAGGLIGVALDHDGSDGAAVPSAQAATRPAPVRALDTPSATAAARLTPEAVYRRDAPGVLVITDTQTEVSPPTFFTPSLEEQV